MIDVSGAHIWDISSVAALDMAVLKFRREGADVELVGLNQASETIVHRLAIHDEPGGVGQAASPLRWRNPHSMTTIVSCIDGSI